MSTAARPYGLLPVRRADGMPYSGATERIKMTNSYGTSIFKGDVVQIVAAGTLEKVSNVGTNADPFPVNTIGVFMGCEYTDPNTSQKLFRNFWTASTSATDNYAYVVTDPMVLFQIQSDDAVPQTALGINIGVNQTAGSTLTGVSAVAADFATIAVTNTLGFKIVGFVDAPGSTVGDAFTDILVKFNPLSHGLTNGTGL